jgi:flagellar motility protein MotE (MotC chaperone)
MKLAPPRLLPIVIAATAALLLFKGIGLVTEGGYSLIGTTAVQAAGGGGGHGGGEATGETPDAASTGVDMLDQDPTLEDPAVTMEFPSEAADEGGHGGASEDGGHGSETPEVGPSDVDVPAEACPPSDAAAEATDDGHGGGEAAPIEGPCLPDAGVNEYGDALPLIKDPATGTMVPLADTIEDTSSETAINERLAERRTELDQREKELDMRLTLMDAAEQRIAERTAELKALEERIGKLVDDNKMAEEQQFVSLVAMYENMKPKDAAVIFNELDMPVLLGVTKAMNPRKMAPILARMDPLKAKALTDGIAAANAPPAALAATTDQDLTNLPQIVGQ